MENTTRPCLPADVVNRAIRLIVQQETTPESPGSRTPDGRVTLCAGAALAVAGLEIQGDFHRAGELREGITSSGAEDHIRRVFVEQGWSSELCDRIRILNDTFSMRERTQGVVEYLHALRSRPDPRSGIGNTGRHE